MKQVKKLLCGMLIVCMIVAGITIVPQNVQAATEDFVIENGVLIEYKGAGGKVVIPDGVTEISTFVFQGNKDVTEIVIPQSVTLCNTGCFALCPLLKTITFKNSATKLDYDWIEQKSSWEEGAFFPGKCWIDDAEFPMYADYKKISRNTLTIKGYKDSSAQKLAQKIVTLPYGYKSVKFVDLDTNKTTTYGIKVPSNLNIKKGKTSMLKITLPTGIKKVSNNPCWHSNTSGGTEWSNQVVVSYKSSNQNVATVNSKGKITAKKKGTAKIIVTVSWGKDVYLNNMGDVHTFQKTFTTTVKVK